MDMGFQSSLGEIPDLDPMGFYCSRYGILVGSQIYHLVMTNIAIENPRTKWWFIAGNIIYKWAIFHGYVK